MKKKGRWNMFAWMLRLPVAWIVGLALLGLSPTTPLAFGDDAEVRRELQRLADKNAEVRKATMEALARSKDGRLVDFFRGYQEGAVYGWKGQLVICRKPETDDSGRQIAPLRDALTGDALLADDGTPLVVPFEALVNVSPSGRERRAAADAVRLLEIWSPDIEKRLAAIQQFGDSRNPEFLEPLAEALESAAPERVRRKTQESIWLIQLAGNLPNKTREMRLEAARGLGEMRSARAAAALTQLINEIEHSRAAGQPADEQAATVYRQALEQIERYQRKVRGFSYLFSGISLGSVLVLMALGLSIIFGQMGVINMAHGELMMIGAYATYETQLLFGHTPDDPSNWYYLVAFPIAFCSAALVGCLIEMLVVRRLYGRPLETLLATWGVSLVLIQATRVKYGDNIGVNSPTWLVGGAEIIPGLIIPYGRAFIILLCVSCVLFIYCLMRYTKLGLLIRATVQHREAAEGLGVNTRRIDAYTFALGSGLAGIAGYAFTLIGGVTPNMGQNYIVDSFLVVVAGGIGELAGVVAAGLGIGVLNKVLEPLSFGEALFASGLAGLVICWTYLTVKGFREGTACGLRTLFLPPYAIRFRSSPGVPVAIGLWAMSLAAIVVSQFGGSVFGGVLGETVQAIWAKVLILLAVVVFVRWKPAGLFPPKGRLADV